MKKHLGVWTFRALHSSGHLKRDQTECILDGVVQHNQGAECCRHVCICLRRLGTWQRNASSESHYWTELPVESVISLQPLSNNMRLLHKLFYWLQESCSLSWWSDRYIRIPSCLIAIISIRKTQRVKGIRSREVTSCFKHGLPAECRLCQPSIYHSSGELSTLACSLSDYVSIFAATWSLVASTSTDLCSSQK